jgi:EAL domain-containing protein (putative c-di-GMP-specific phosphodiesterase class I)
MSLVVQPISELIGQPDRKPSSKLDIYVMIKDAEGELPASRFIREARASGLIRYVDRWVIQNACKILRANLQKEGPMLLFLRLSRQSLHDATLVPALGHEARDKGIPPECLSFELIQSDTVDLTADEIQALRQIKEAGFLLTVSGLGANPASQSLLQQLPVDFIKLDPKLTEKAEQSDNARKLIQEFVQAANARNTGVISTQVPNATVMAALWNLGVHYVQGNYLQEPEIVLQA